MALWVCFLSYSSFPPPSPPPTPFFLSFFLFSPFSAALSFLLSFFLFSSASAPLFLIHLPSRAAPTPFAVPVSSEGWGVGRGRGEGWSRFCPSLSRLVEKRWSVWCYRFRDRPIFFHFPLSFPCANRLRRFCFFFLFLQANFLKLFSKGRYFFYTRSSEFDYSIFFFFFFGNNNGRS